MAAPPPVPFALAAAAAQAQGLAALAAMPVPAALDPAGMDALAADGLGDLAWLLGTRALRLHPARFAPWARCVLLCALDHQAEPGHGRLRRARYAAGKDYHGILRRKLAAVARAIDPDAQQRACADSAPVNERTLARMAGLGWIGRNALLIDPGAGSYRVLGAVFLGVEVATRIGVHGADRCGACTRCEAACPTAALRDRRVISERCISYLTIEYRGVIPRALAERFAGWWFGCDRCQEVCPWNRFAPGAADPRLGGSDRDADLLAVTAATFDQVFAGRAVRRLSFERFRRNLLVAAFSLGDLATARAIAADPLPLVQAQARELGLAPGSVEQLAQP